VLSPTLHFREADLGLFLIFQTHSSRRDEPEHDSAAYAKIFPELAKKYGDLVYPSFKDGVTGHPELLQDDGAHANSKGVAIIVERISQCSEARIGSISLPHGGSGIDFAPYNGSRLKSWCLDTTVSASSF
jgi:hypothetical protein